MRLSRPTLLSFGLLLGLAVATQSACNKDTSALATDGLRGEWYLRDIAGGFRMGPPPSYDLTSTPERLSFSDGGTLVYERFDTLGKQTSRSEHRYEITASTQEPLGDAEITKLTVRYAPEVEGIALGEIWLEDEMLVLTRHAMAYDGTSKRFARVSE